MPSRITIPTSVSRGSVFSPLEWLVIAMGTKVGSVPLPLSSFGRALLDMLPDDGEDGGDRLETLRRTSSLARRCGWGMPAIEMGAFLRAGWSEEQLEALIESASGTAAPSADERRTFDSGHGAEFSGERYGSRTMMEMH